MVIAGPAIESAQYAVYRNTNKVLWRVLKEADPVDGPENKKNSQ